jgi:hypothetical protein
VRALFKESGTDTQDSNLFSLPRDPITIYISLNKQITQINIKEELGGEKRKK